MALDDYRDSAKERANSVESSRGGSNSERNRLDKSLVAAAPPERHR
jgi:hypothetical protein